MPDLVQGDFVNIFVNYEMPMELLPLIRRLLYREDCVIIPGLGGFVSQHHPSRILPGSGTFIPPAKEVGYNRELVHNDGLLQDYVAEQKSVSPEEARQMIGDFVHEVHRRTARGEKVIMEGVGYFFDDGTGKVHFQIDAGINFLLDSYGLSPFHVRQIDQVRDAGSQVLPGSMRTDAGNLRETGKGGEFLVPGRNVSRIILIALPLIVLLGLVPRNPDSGRKLTPAPASMAPRTIVPSEGQSVEKTPDQSNEASYPVNESGGTSAGDLPAGDPAPVRMYPLVAGSFRSEANALDYADLLRRKGFPATVAWMPNRFHRVVLESFETYEEALAEFNRIRRTNPSLDLWIDK